MWLSSIFIIAFISKGALSDDFLSSSYYVTDQCVNLCKGNDLPSLDLENYEQIVCQRGCRFFNIIRFKNDLNLNTTKKECHLSCEESYIIQKEAKICLTGCELMAKKCQVEFSSFIILTENEESDNIVLAEPDLEILESDILSDPSIKSQLEIGFNIDYKIPETRIRTMPIELKDEVLIVKSNDASGDWLDCASRNSGVPRWILLMAILSAVLIALWLSFSSEKKDETDEKAVDVEVSDEKLIINCEEIDQSEPPKFVLESEKV